jgi:hypothetical protein
MISYRNSSLKSCATALLMVVFSFSALQSQTPQNLMKKLSLYEDKYPEEGVYIQTDRNQFAPGEVLWFKAYVMDELGSHVSSAVSDLYVALVDQDSLVVANGKFFIADRKAEGSLVIPAQLTPGRYMLIGYTGWMKNTPDDRIFANEILIEKSEKSALKIQVRLSDTICRKEIANTAFITMNTSDNIPVSSSFTYSINGAGVKSVDVKGKTDKLGNAQITFTVPPYREGENTTLTVSAGNKGHKSTTAVIIPTAENYLNVIFYPESGMLIYGADSKIAFRGFNIAGQPVDFAGELYNKDNQLIKRVWSDFRGIGSFQLTPEKGQTYYLKIVSPSGISASFNLPTPRRSGILMSVFDKNTEKMTLSVTQVNKTGQVYHFIGQMKGRIYWMESRKIDKTAKLEVPVSDFPGGVAEIAVFDTSLTLVAKRLVFINKTKKLNIGITADKTSYPQRGKTTLVINAKDENGSPVEASLALSVVRKDLQATIPDNNNLYTYAFLTSDLVGFIPEPMYYFSGGDMSDETLDNLLIANAYKRFTWHDILAVTERSPAYKSVSADNSLKIDTKAEKARNAYFANELANLLKSPGIPYAEQEKNNMQNILNPNAAVGERKDNLNSNLSIMDMIYQKKPYKMIDGKIVFASNGPNTISNQQGAAIAIDGIYRGTDPSVLSTIPQIDVEKVYVSTNPVDIQRYTGLNAIGIIEIYTKSASSARRTLETNSQDKGSLMAPLFQSPDYASGTYVKPKTDTRKTIFWAPDIQTDQSGQAIVTFYNGDIPGDVTITVEGISTTGVAGSGEGTYTIK